MPSKQGVNRRKFILAGAGCAAAAGIGYLTKDLWYPLTQKTTAPEAASPTQTQTPTNSPPYASFQLVKPKYILPAVGQEVQFLNKSTDPDGDALSCRWYVNEIFESKSKDLSFKPKEAGTHSVKLEVSDGKLKDEKEYSFLDVESGQIYPTKSLNVKYEGMRYSAGAWAPYAQTLTPGIEEMNEQLDTIRHELGCNAILIFSGTGYEDNLINCGNLAIKKGFERIYIQPEYMDATIDQTIEYLSRFTEKVKPLREMSESVVLMVGHEFGLETYGIIPGNNWYDRLFYQTKHNDWLDKVRATIPSMLGKIISLCKQNYGYPVSYSAAIWEDDLVPWKDPVFESVCTDAYVMDSVGWTANWIMNHLSSLKRFNKPVNSAEWGCMTFTGAGPISGTSPLYVEQNPYDENEQANYIKHYLEMLNLSNISGSFYTLYADPSTYNKGFGLLRDGNSRKRGFYMYKSYQRVGS
ncbi:MAG: PKD domain-containing protein [Candidatus Bathyarchaeota archaeon]|nr:PKD domain-containing protein [Candidatus Bathyarchaeota archaeon]